MPSPSAPSPLRWPITSHIEYLLSQTGYVRNGHIAEACVTKVISIQRPESLSWVCLRTSERCGERNQR